MVCGTFAVVDKPAGVACSAGAGGVGIPTPLPERLAAHGLADVEVISGVRGRESGTEGKGAGAQGR